MTSSAQMQSVRDYFFALQTHLCQSLAAIDGGADFSIEDIHADNGAHSRPRVLDGGRYIERGAVQYSYSLGAQLPAAASERNPHLAGVRVAKEEKLFKEKMGAHPMCTTRPSGGRTGRSLANAGRSHRLLRAYSELSGSGGKAGRG